MHTVLPCNDSQAVHRVDQITRHPCILLELDKFPSETRRPPRDEQCLDDPVVVRNVHSEVNDIG